jgi:hypothetical protein
MFLPRWAPLTTLLVGVALVCGCGQKTTGMRNMQPDPTAKLKKVRLPEKPNVPKAKRRGLPPDPPDPAPPPR